MLVFPDPLGADIKTISSLKENVLFSKHLKFLSFNSIIMSLIH
ncbi:055R [Invertebrate iridescent virus Kaz2018]|nr:055R [Invertebrate iridescent virus Kaz2018]